MIDRLISSFDRGEISAGERDRLRAFPEFPAFLRDCIRAGNAAATGDEDAVDSCAALYFFMISAPSLFSADRFRAAAAALNAPPSLVERDSRLFR